ncbi:MAG: hypothetical protein CYPHOPRED_000850 [Cyphobasidiales sp. Tagirdzhanova-0007]|nr:MAG: hypothetical protein CYPHOPRED_000850 [Cyphobasidiales sp. Tagirdzhanova-0007]
MLDLTIRISKDTQAASGPWMAPSSTPPRLESRLANNTSLPSTPTSSLYSSSSGSGPLTPESCPDARLHGLSPSAPYFASQRSLSLAEECDAQEKAQAQLEAATSKRQKQRNEKTLAIEKRNALPNPLQLQQAMRCRVYTEDGRNIEFGHAIRANWGGITIAVFVRHMWCGLCQEFLKSIRQIDEACYRSEGVEIVVVGCGDPTLIRKYKETAKFDGRMYSDPSGELQERLGMTLRTLNPGKDAEKGEYQQMSMLKNGLVSAANGLKMLSRNPGRFDRLGGEMVFDVDEATDETLCYYAHRMTNTRSHGPLDKLFGAAGVSIVTKPDNEDESMEYGYEGQAQMSCAF